eukprot:6899373-Heterocapsa_arctica.AAC.1
MATAARALRLAKQLANEPGWTLWNMARFPEVLQKRLAHLRVVPAFESLPLRTEEAERVGLRED